VGDGVLVAHVEEHERRRAQHAARRLDRVLERQIDRADREVADRCRFDERTVRD
jgi:hypothetical protein